MSKMRLRILDVTFFHADVTFFRCYFFSIDTFGGEILFSQNPSHDIASIV